MPRWCSSATMLDQPFRSGAEGRMVERSIAKTGLMAGKRGLVMGVANDHSIAWGIARTLAVNGAELAFTYQGEAQGKRLRPLAHGVGSRLVIPCDVANDAELNEGFDILQSEWDRLDFLVHAIAFSDRNE